MGRAYIRKLKLNLGLTLVHRGILFVSNTTVRWQGDQIKTKIIHLNEFVRGLVRVSRRQRRFSIFLFRQLQWLLIGLLKLWLLQN